MSPIIKQLSPAKSEVKEAKEEMVSVDLQESENDQAGLGSLVDAIQ